MTVLDALKQLDTLLDCTDSDWYIESATVDKVVLALLDATAGASPPVVIAAMLKFLKTTVKTGVVCLENCESQKKVKGD